MLGNKVDKMLKNFIGKLNLRNYAATAKFETKPFKLHRLDSGPNSSVTITKEEAIDYYTKMSTIRKLETASGNLYKDKIVRGFCHLYSGQEAVAIGIKSVMRPQDNIITSYRAHGWTYLMGVPLVGVLAELTGREIGNVRGKGGSMHMYAPHFFGGNGIVGAQVPLGAGIALSCKYREDSGVCFALYGDGAANQGQIFEAYNMSALWKLPCIYVCENNGYGMGTSANRAAANADYYTRGDIIPGLWVDGMDVSSVRAATEFSIDYALNKGPIVMELNTYRYYGHSMSDPGVSYRTREEVQETRKQRDPINNFKSACVEKNLLTEEEIKSIDSDIKKEIDKATEEAKAAKEVPLDELHADVYDKNYEAKIRGTLGYYYDHKKINTGINQ